MAQDADLVTEGVDLGGLALDELLEARAIDGLLIGAGRAKLGNNAACRSAEIMLHVLLGLQEIAHLVEARGVVACRVGEAFLGPSDLHLRAGQGKGEGDRGGAIVFVSLVKAQCRRIGTPFCTQWWYTHTSVRLVQYTPRTADSGFSNQSRGTSSVTIPCCDYTYCMRPSLLRLGFANEKSMRECSLVVSLPDYGTPNCLSRRAWSLLDLLRAREEGSERRVAEECHRRQSARNLAKQHKAGQAGPHSRGAE